MNLPLCPRFRERNRVFEKSWKCSSHTWSRWKSRGKLGIELWLLKGIRHVFHSGTLVNPARPRWYPEDFSPCSGVAGSARFDPFGCGELRGLGRLRWAGRVPRSAGDPEPPTRPGVLLTNPVLHSISSLLPLCFGFEQQNPPSTPHPGFSFCRLFFFKMGKKFILIFKPPIPGSIIRAGWVSASFATELHGFSTLFAEDHLFFSEKQGARGGLPALPSPAARLGQGVRQQRGEAGAKASCLPPPVRGMEQVAMENRDYSAHVCTGVRGEYGNFFLFFLFFFFLKKNPNICDGARCRRRPCSPDLGSRNLRTPSPSPPPRLLLPQLLHWTLISDNPPVRGLSACYDTQRKRGRKILSSPLSSAASH